jgi:hypothetical protein
MMLTTNGISIQVAKTDNTSSKSFRATMAEKWQGLTAKNWLHSMGQKLYPFRL